MARFSDINPYIIEALYTEALLLADDVRSAFDMSGRIALAGRDEDLGQVALSCEALRATTRMMHIIAWLLNQRAFFNGELSEFQLRRHGRLLKDKPAQNPGHIEMLDPERRDLVERTRHFHARIARLDTAWRDGFDMNPGAVHRLRERLGHAVQHI